MAERHISFEQLSDVMAFRVIVGDLGDCYRALGLIHQTLADGPGPLQGLHLDAQAQRLPRLHTSVIHDSKMRIEIQIRSTRHARAGRARARRPLGL